MQANSSWLRERAISVGFCLLGLSAGFLIVMWLSVCLIVIVESAAKGDENADKAKAALALAQAAREREVKAKSLAKIAGIKEESDRCFVNITDARLASKAQSRPLVLWVGLTCGDHQKVHDALPEAIHCHVNEYHGSKTPRLIVTDPDGVEYKIEKFDATTPLGIRRRMGLIEQVKSRPKAIVIEQ